MSKEKLIEGQKIKYMRTQGSMYDNDSLLVNIEGNTNYRIKADEILKMVNKFKFKEVKKKKYTYLEVI